MGIKLDKTQRIIAIIAGIFAIIGGGGLFGWREKMFKTSEPQVVVIKIPSEPVSPAANGGEKKLSESGKSTEPKLIKDIEPAKQGTIVPERIDATGESGYQLNERFALGDVHK